MLWMMSACAAIWPWGQLWKKKLALVFFWNCLTDTFILFILCMMVTSAEFYTHATFDDLMLPDTLVLGSHISKLHLLCKFLIKFKFVLVLHKWAQLLTNCLLWLWNVSSGNNWHISVLCRNFFFFLSETV